MAIDSTKGRELVEAAFRHLIAADEALQQAGDLPSEGDYRAALQSSVLAHYRAQILATCREMGEGLAGRPGGA